MKKITLLLLFIFASYTLIAQTLNQSANWANNTWTLSGAYDATFLIENPTTTSANLSFDDNQAGGGSVNSVAAESPIISLIAAYNAVETWITVSSAYVFNAYQAETLTLQYWDADSASWMNWGVSLSETPGAPTVDFCGVAAEQFTSSNLNISAFSSNQLSNFRYRIFYNDNGSWGWGFCFNSPTIMSQAPPACPNINSLNVSNISVNTADASWQAGNAETSWEVVIQASGTGVPTGSGITTSNNNPYELTGLTENTAYEVYVRGDCGGGDFSNWVGPVTFTTLIPSRINFIQNNFPVSGTYDLAVVDMNGDFLDDIVSVDGSSVNIFYQLSSGGFSSEDNIPTSSADFLPSWSMAAGDIDADGYTDLLYGNGSGVTFMKANGTGDGFIEMSGSEYVFSQRSNFIDINNDGHLDAFVCHDVEPNVYYINDGNGNFTFYQGDDPDGVSGGLGVYSSGGNYGSIWIDYDNDRDMDMFIAKCGGETARRTNQLHRNNGDGSFTEVGSTSGLADPMQTWSSTWGDYDNDGDMDVFVGGSSDPHKLMENNGDGTFTNITATSGVSVVSTLGHENVSYDFDNDGNLDIACNGVILYGNGDNTFTEIDSDELNYKNGSFGDLNNDGFIDAYFNGILYRNDANSNNWLKIHLIGKSYETANRSNRNGIGARVELYTDTGIQIRDVRSGEGFEYMSSLNTHFGLGSQASINTIVVYWPSGIIDTIVNPGVNSVLTIEEGETLTTEDNTLSNVVVFPNPVKDILIIETPINITDRVATVFDINGKRVLNSKLDRNTLNVSKLQSGLYFLRLEAKGKSIQRKFIKQ